MSKKLRTPDKVKKVKKSRLTRTRLFALLAVIAVTAGIGTVVFSQSGPGNGKKNYVATREIIFDQASQKLRKPTADETQAIVDRVSALTNQSSEGLTVNQGPNGMKWMNAEDRFSGVVLGRAKADGTTEIRCVMSMAEAAEFLGLEESAE